MRKIAAAAAVTLAAGASVLLASGSAQAATTCTVDHSTVTACASVDAPAVTLAPVVSPTVTFIDHLLSLLG